jgi:TonB family protein
LNTEKLLLVLWFAILLVLLIAPAVKRYRKVKQFNSRDEFLEVQASWMAAPITMKYPGELKRKGVEASVIVEISFNKNCEFSSACLLQSSGEKLFDESVLKAVENAKLLANKELIQQWKVTFKLEMLSVMPQL